ncbi:MAG TPA: tetratricopeptide repeat protein [Kofleriaceae bacterium]|nr:tetratricopeptide repeat protein [Kofleriaceae bacterium]
MSLRLNSGELALRPLPALLLDFHESFANGRLTIRRGKVLKHFDLVNGNPMSAASTPRDETLGHFLVANGVITDAVHQDAVARAVISGDRLGETLVAMGAMSLEVLFEQLRRQARFKLISSLRWPQGTWRFDANIEAAGGMALRMTDVVLLGLKETATEDGVRLSRLDNMTFQLNPRGLRMRGDLRRAFGDPVIEVVGRKAATREIENAVGDPILVRTALDAMMLCDAVDASADATAAADQRRHQALGSIALVDDDNLAVPLPYVAPAPPSPTARTTARVPAPMRAPAPAIKALDEPMPPVVAPPADDTLIDDLFDGMTHQTNEGSVPIAVTDPDESGVVALDVVSSAQQQSAEASAVRRKVAAEHVRIRGLDHYGVLMIARNASAADISVALADRRSEFSRDFMSRYGLGLDQYKLEELHQAYQRAYDTLLDDVARRLYDQELAGGELPVVSTTFGADLKFRVAEQLMREERWDEAVTSLLQVAATAGDEADYLAALGWALWHQQGKVGTAIDAARNSLNAALTANPDHAGAHQYRGILEAEVGVDAEGALFHLERAVEIDPARNVALDKLEQMLIARGDLRRLERICKRVVFRLNGAGGPEIAAWLRLVRVFWALDESSAARSAFRSAEAIAANAPEVVKMRKELEARPSSTRIELDNNGQRTDVTATGALRTAEASAAVDAAFIQASCDVALAIPNEPVDAQIATRYERYRRVAVLLPAAPLEAHHWAKLRHPADTVELGGLMDLLAPVIDQQAPLALRDVDLDPGARLDSTVLPTAFARTLHECARLLDVAVPAVFSRPELGNQIHVVAVSPPVLVAGDEALTAAERPELVFQAVRALSLATPGRAIGGSRQGRVLRAAAMAAFGEVTGTAPPQQDTAVVAATEILASLSAGQRSQIRALAQRFLARGQALNLSAWSRALVRTADRVGLLLCGDVPAAFAAARELGELNQDLIDFARSRAHCELRSELRILVR